MGFQIHIYSDRWCWLIFNFNNVFDLSWNHLKHENFFSESIQVEKYLNELRDPWNESTSLSISKQTQNLGQRFSKESLWLRLRAMHCSMIPKQRETLQVLSVFCPFGIWAANRCKRSMCGNFMCKYNIKNEATVCIITNKIPCY